MNGSSDAKEENLSHEQKPNGSRQQESKLELFGFDSLVNILGLKRYIWAFLAATVTPLQSLDVAFKVCIQYYCYPFEFEGGLDKL